MNKDFSFATCSQKIKSYVVESQITLLVCPCLNHLQKNIAQLITWSFLMIHSVSFTSAAFESFAEAYLCFSVSVSAKQNAEVIRFLGFSKKFFVFHAIFRLDFKTQIIYCITHRRPVFSFDTFFVLLYQSLRNRT